MECPQCLETLRPGETRCPACGWEASAASPSEGGAAAVSAAGVSPAGKEAACNDTWVARWRSQFEKLRVTPHPEVLARARRLMARAETQMRLATVLFLDLTGFSAQSTLASADAINAVLQRFCDLSMETAATHNGFVVQFLGDGVFIVFGAPIAYDADAVSAVAAARDLIRELLDLRWPSGAPVRSRAGVATGEILSTIQRSAGTETYNLVGTTVNLAARLEQNAQPGEILVCPATAERIAPLYETVPTDPMRLKNVSDAYVAHRVVAQRDRPLPDRPTVSEFVGRSREVERICSAFGGAGDRVRPRLVEIVGELGIGKTRLVQEAVERLKPTHTAILLRNAPHGVHILFYPVIAWLRDVLHLPADLPASQLNDTLRESGHQGLRLEEDERLLVGLLLGSTEGREAFRGVPPPALRERFFQCFTDLARQMAGDRAPLLIFDDMHWTDEVTRAWLHWLRGRVGERVDLIVIRRAEATDLDAAPTRDTTALPEPDVRIHLRSLDPPDASRLLRELIGEEKVSESLLEKLRDRTAGNPLFSIQMARALLAILEEQDAAAADTLLPDSLRALLQWRMDRLSDRARLILQCGAVLGLEFSRDLLEFFDEVRADLHDQLRLLKAKTFLEERSKRPDLILRFCHPLTRDVAYQALLPGQRQALHRHVAERLEAEFPEPGPELQDALAHHWHQGGQPDKAAYWLIKCADARERLGGYQAAIEAGTKALQLLDAAPNPAPAHLQRTVRLLMRLARLETDLGRLDEGAAHLQRVVEIAERLDNDFVLAEFALWCGVHAYRSGDVATALPLLEEAESRARNLDLPRIFVPALNTRGLIAWQQALPEEALSCFDKVARVGAERNVPSWQADALNNAGLVLWRLGRFEEALDRFRASLPLRRAIHDRANTAVTLLNIGSVQQTLGRFGDAENSYADCEALARRIGHQACLLALLPNRSVLALHRGDLAAAADHAARGIQCAERANDLRAEACARLNLADTLVEMDRLAEAGRQARQARNVARRGRCDEEIRLSATLSWIGARLLMQGRERGANAAVVLLIQDRERDAAARPPRTASDLRALRRILPRCEAEATLGRIIPRALALEALAHTLAGRAAEAAEAAQRARNALTRTGDPLESRVVERLLAARPAT